jgi:hypothetical protein
VSVDEGREGGMGKGEEDELAGGDEEGRPGRGGMKRAESISIRSIGLPTRPLGRVSRTCCGLSVRAGDVDESDFKTGRKREERRRVVEGTVRSLLALERRRE